MSLDCYTKLALFLLELPFGIATIFQQGQDEFHSITHGVGPRMEVTRLKRKLIRLLSASKEKTFTLNSLAPRVMYQNL